MERITKRLLNRGGRERITDELIARKRASDGSDVVVYSTQQAEERRLSSEAYLKKVGTESCVSKAYNPHIGNKGSNRRSFYTFAGETRSDQEISGRTMRK